MDMIFRGSSWWRKSSSMVNISGYIWNKKWNWRSKSQNVR